MLSVVNTSNIAFDTKKVGARINAFVERWGMKTSLEFTALYVLLHLCFWKNGEKILREVEIESVLTH